MINRECLKGWILAPSPTDGENVPFFVYVRDKDIIWDENNLPKKINEISNLGENRELFHPATYWKFDYNGWKIVLNQDGSYKAKKKINIGRLFDKVENNYAKITADLDLPFETLNNNEFSIHFTQSSDKSSICSANAGITPITDDIKAFNVIQIYLFASPYYFSSIFKETKEYDDSYLYISIEGDINIE